MSSWVSMRKIAITDREPSALTPCDQTSTRANINNKLRFYSSRASTVPVTLRPCAPSQ